MISFERRLILQEPAYRLSVKQIFCYFIIIAVVGEVVFPRLSNRFTADILDVVFYALGGGLYITAQGSRQSVEELLDTVIEKYSNIYEQYAKATDVESQRNIISSMFPEKITFDGLQHRTLRPSEPLELILLINSKIEGIKKGKNIALQHLSPKVARRGIKNMALS